jgi:hypothetical protein
MSLAIVLGGWTAASILLSPLIGRFLAGSAGEGGFGGEARRSLDRPKSPGSVRSAHAATRNMRRNAAAELHRREAGWPRAV